MSNAFQIEFGGGTINQLFELATWQENERTPAKSEDLYRFFRCSETTSMDSNVSFASKRAHFFARKYYLFALETLRLLGTFLSLL